MADPLEEIVAEGRHKREKAHGAEARDQRERERAIDRETKRRLWGSVSSFALWTWWAYGSAIGVAAAVIAHATLRNDGDASSGIGFATGIAALVIAWWLRPAFGRRALARDEAKLRALPFRVSGYAAALSSNSTEGKATLVIRFVEGDKITANESASFRDAGAVVEATAPDDKTIADAFFAIGATLGEPRKNGARVVEWEISGGDSSFSTNAHLAKWIWRATRVLEAIHARFPIASVELHGFR